MKTIGIALVALVAAGLVSAAEPIFTLVQPASHTLSPREPNVIPLLFSSAQEIPGVRVTLVQVTTPRGYLLPLDLFTIEPREATVAPAGSTFTLKVKEAAAFKDAGTYAGTLRVTGVLNNTPQAQLVPITITVPQPAVDVTRHQNVILRVRRLTPWSRITLDETFRFDESSGRANVADLKVSAQDVFFKGTRDRAGTAVVSADSSGTAATLPAGGQREVRLTVKDLDKAGVFTTGLLLTSPSLAAAIAVPLEIDVADKWPLPLTVIFLGVLLGAVIRHLSQVARPREAARFRRSLLATQVARFRDRSRDPQQLQELEAIDDILNRCDQQLQLGDVAAATTLLDQADAALAAFRKAWEEKFRSVLKRLRDAGTRIDEIAARISETDTEDLASLATARQHLTVAQQAMTTFDLPLAESRIVSAVVIADALHTAHPPQAAGRGLVRARAQAIGIRIAEAPEDHIAGRPLSFVIDDTGRSLAPGDQFEWDFGDGVRLTTADPNARHPYLSAGSVRVRVAVLRAESEIASAALTVDVLPRPIEQLAAQRERSLMRITAVLTATSLVLAVLTGAGLMFLGKSFGTPQQYLEAFLWGFGIDSGVKNVADLLKKVG